MRLGRTTVILFGGQVASSAVGFAATVYFARFLGARVLGFYAVTMALASWLILGGTMGVSSAVQKRMSEENDPEEHFAAGFILITLFAITVIGLLFLFRTYINNYVGAEVSIFLAEIILVQLLFTIIGAGLKGQRRVHTYGIIKPIRQISQSVGQFILIVPVVFGMGLTGLFFGNIVGTSLATILAVFFLGIELRRPQVCHFRNLLSFAKYSWLSQVESRTFKQADIFIMGFFVATSLVGVYSIVWSLAMFLTLFGNSIRATLFPEISNASASIDEEPISLLKQGVSYEGLIMIPGLIGGTILSDEILRIYGAEFTQGSAVLWILLFAVLLKGYQSEFLTALNGINRPELAFRIYAVFISSNIVLNIGLIYLYGWTGAAAATALSTVIGLSLSYVVIKNLTQFNTPTRIIIKQWIAALIMGSFVYSALWVDRTYQVFNSNLVLVIVLVSIAAVIYFITLLTISHEFRKTIRRNIPFSILSFKMR